MKKYYSLSELIRDFRKHNNLSQADLAGVLDVDIRSIQRWEAEDTVIGIDKEKIFVEKLNIPYQVIRNLNTTNPLPVFYDVKTRTYSLSVMMIRPNSAEWYKSDLPSEDDKIRMLANDSDIEFVNDMERLSRNPKPVNPELLKQAAKILPELNIILEDDTGNYAGHVTFLPLKYSSYLKIKNKEINESSLTVFDLDRTLDGSPKVFYFYSIYADTMPNSYYLVNRMLSYFKNKKFEDYIFAGISYKAQQVEYLKELGLRIVRQEEVDKSVTATLLEGNLDEFLFG